MGWTETLGKQSQGHSSRVSYSFTESFDLGLPSLTWVGDHELIVSDTVPGARQSLRKAPVMTALGHQPMALAPSPSNLKIHLLIRQTV